MYILQRYLKILCRGRGRNRGSLTSGLENTSELLLGHTMTSKAPLETYKNIGNSQAKHLYSPRPLTFVSRFSWRKEEKRILSSTFFVKLTGLRWETSGTRDESDCEKSKNSVCSNHSTSSQCLVLVFFLSWRQCRSIYFHSQIIDILEILFRSIHLVLLAAAAPTWLLDETPKWISIIFFSCDVCRFFSHLFMPPHRQLCLLTFPECHSWILLSQ